MKIGEIVYWVEEFTGINWKAYKPVPKQILEKYGGKVISFDDETVVVLRGTEIMFLNRCRIKWLTFNEFVERGVG